MHLTLHLTKACSMRCDYCYAPPQPGRSMDLATANRALDLAQQRAGGKSAGIIFFGGEPLLCRDLIAQTVAMAREREAADVDRQTRFHFKLTTNGVDLDQGHSKFRQLKCRVVCVPSMAARERSPTGAPALPWL